MVYSNHLLRLAKHGFVNSHLLLSLILSRYSQITSAKTARTSTYWIIIILSFISALQLFTIDAVTIHTAPTGNERIDICVGQLAVL